MNKRATSAGVRSDAWDAQTALQLFLSAQPPHTDWHSIRVTLTGREALPPPGDLTREDAALDAVWQLPLRLGQQELGVLHAVPSETAAVKRAYPPQLLSLAEQCALIGARWHSQAWVAQRRLSAPCLLGFSEAITALDAQMAAVVTHNKPVLLCGASYNEALQTAAAIHYVSATQTQAFVVIDWANLLDSPHRVVECARGGTLFMHSMNSLDGQAHDYVWQQFRHALQTMASTMAAPHVMSPCAWSHGGCRLIIALTQGADASAHVLPHDLHAQHCTCIELPSLTQREQDIPWLMRSVMDYYGHDAQRRLSPHLQHWCVSYHWPGHAAQFERILARMALLSSQTPLGEHAIAQFAPRVEPPASQAAGHEVRGWDWGRLLAQDDMGDWRHLHPALQRALHYLKDHWREALSMAQLAAVACVSASHLRYLLQKNMGMSFKQLLQALRIAHAKRMILARPHRQITEIALSVGFNDLSYFQKCFRRATGQTPTQLRKQG